MLVTLANLTTYMDISLSPRQQDAAEMILQGLQSELESFLGRPVEVTSFTDETHVLDASHVSIPIGSYFYNEGLTLGDANPGGIVTYSQPPSTVYLRNTPCVSVSKITIDGPNMNNKVLGEANKRVATITAATTQTAAITGAVKSGNNVTYTATNTFTVNDIVTVTGITPSGLNCTSKAITSRTSSTFTIVNSAATGTYASGGSVAGGVATYTAADHKITIGQVVTITDVVPTTLNLSAKIVTAVTSTTFSVASSGVYGVYTSGGTVTANGEDYTVRRYGVDIYTGFANDIIKITYTGGVDGPNIKMFKLMILRAATREMQNMHDDVVGVKDLNPRGVSVSETGFMENELIAIKRYSRRRIG